jgi:predicted alpha/beta hydrolase
MRTGQQGFARQAERRNGLVTSHGRGMAEEFVQRFASFEVVK